MADEGNWWDDSGFSLGGNDSGNWWDSGSGGSSAPDYTIPSFQFSGANDWGKYSQNSPLPNSSFTNQPMGTGLNPAWDARFGGGMYGAGMPASAWLGQQPQGGGGYGGGQGQGWGAMFSNPQTLLGLGGGLAGLIGALSGGGQGASTNPQLTNNQKYQYGQAQSAAGGLGKFAQGNTPLQQQQASLLQAIASGQGLAQPYAQAIEGSFEPKLGALYNQASNAGRQRGFHDAPATSPAGGAILGPGLSDLQGQIAQAKIAMMMGLPGLYQQPINQQGQMAQAFAGAQGNLYSAGPFGSQQRAPLGPQIGQGVGNAMIGLGQGFGQQQQQDQQRQFQNLFLQLMGRQAGVPTSPFSFTGSYGPNSRVEGQLGY